VRSRAADLRQRRGSGSQSGFDLRQAIPRWAAVGLQGAQTGQRVCRVKIFLENQIFDQSSSLPSWPGASARRRGFSLPGSRGLRPSLCRGRRWDLGGLRSPAQRHQGSAQRSRALPGSPRGTRNPRLGFRLSLAELCSRHRSRAETSPVFCVPEGEGRVVALWGPGRGLPPSGASRLWTV